MSDHFTESERMLRRGDAGSLVAALIHAVLAVAEEFKRNDCECGCDADPISLSWPPVTDVEVKGDLL